MKFETYLFASCSARATISLANSENQPGIYQIYANVHFSKMLYHLKMGKIAQKRTINASKLWSTYTSGDSPVEPMTARAVNIGYDGQEKKNLQGLFIPLQGHAEKKLK